MSSHISDGKRQVVQTSTFLCAMLFIGIPKDFYNQYWSFYLFNSKLCFSFLVVLGKATVIFCLKDLGTQLWHLLGLMFTSMRSFTE